MPDPLVGVYEDAAGTLYCARSGSDPLKNLGPCCNGVGNPINSGTQNKYLVEADIDLTSGGSPFSLTRTYNSMGAMDDPADPSLFPHPTLFGRHWASTYDTRVVLATLSTAIQTAYVSRADGRIIFFNISGTSWIPDPDIADRLVRTVDGSGNPTGWLLSVAATDDLEVYDVTGRLTAINNRKGTSRTLTYNASNKLAAVQDDFGRQLSFQYGTNGLVSSITEPGGQVTGYQYDT